VSHGATGDWRAPLVAEALVGARPRRRALAASAPPATATGSPPARQPDGPAVAEPPPSGSPFGVFLRERLEAAAWP